MDGWLPAARPAHYCYGVIASINKWKCPCLTSDLHIANLPLRRDPREVNGDFPPLRRGLPRLSRGPAGRDILPGAIRKEKEKKRIKKKNPRTFPGPGRPGGPCPGQVGAVPRGGGWGRRAAPAAVPVPRRSGPAPPLPRSPTGGAAEPRAMRGAPARPGPARDAAPAARPNRAAPALPGRAALRREPAGRAAAGRAPGGAGHLAGAGAGRTAGAVGAAERPGAARGAGARRGAQRPSRARPGGASGLARGSGPTVTSLCHRPEPGSRERARGVKLRRFSCC